MDQNNLNVSLLIVFFGFVAFIVGIFLSKEMAEFGLWIMPALSHLYPIVIVSFVIIYSVITSRRVLWVRLLLIVVLGLSLECFLFWLNKIFIFSSPKVMALYVFSQIVSVYGLTLVLYFYFASRIPSRKT